MEEQKIQGIDLKREEITDVFSYPRILLSGDRGILVEFDNCICQEIHKQIMGFIQGIRQRCEKEMITDLIPSYASVLLIYDPRKITYLQLKEEIKIVLQQETNKKISRKKIIEIPVCYGGNYGQDLSYVAKNANLSQEEVIKLHTSCDYLIYMLGFMPGFPYLGGLDERLYTPRLESPRVKIPAGSVGIGGKQTGIYPLESPGGWQLIGRTPLLLYNPKRKDPIRYQAGDWIRFFSIDEEEYFTIQKQDEAGNYVCRIIEEETEK